MAQEHAAIGWPVRAVVTLGALVNAVVGGLTLARPATFLAFVGHPDAVVTPAVRVLAAYAGARELAIALALVVLLTLRWSQGLAGVLLLAGVANGLDAVVALGTRNWAQLPGALIFAVLFLLAASKLVRAGGVR